jgi:signal peptidase II
MIQTKRLMLVGAVVLVVLFFDHLTKWLAVQYLHDTGAMHEFFGGLFRLVYAENRGAFLSLGATLPDSTRVLLLTGVNVLILSAVFIFLAVRRYLPRTVVWAMALLLSGGLGNILDRIFRDGVVVDFMVIDLNRSIGPLPLRTGVFNIADLAIVGGLLMLVAFEMFGSKQVPALEDTTAVEAKKASTAPPENQA